MLWESLRCMKSLQSVEKTAQGELVHSLLGCAAIGESHKNNHHFKTNHEAPGDSK